MEGIGPEHHRPRGGRIAMGFAGALLLLTLFVRGVEFFYQDYSRIGAMSPPSRQALGCIDYELSEIMRALHAEAFAPDVRGEEIVRAFHVAHAAGLATSGRYEHMRGCAEDFERSSPRVARNAKLEDAVAAVGESVVDVYVARARLLAAKRSQPTMVGAAEKEMQATWAEAESRVNALAGWVAEQIARP